MLKSEVDQEFPLLHGIGTVGLWSLLEATIMSFLAQWLQNQPEALQTDPVSRLRVRIGDYERLTGDDRFSYLVALMDREVSAGLRNGVERFESLLRPFNLVGPVPKNLAKDLFELGQVRNGLVHCGGTVDRELAERCSWLDLRPGDQLRVSQEMFGRYASGAIAYSMLLICRVAQRFDFDLTADTQEIFDKYDT